MRHIVEVLDRIFWIITFLPILTNSIPQSDTPITNPITHLNQTTLTKRQPVLNLHRTRYHVYSVRRTHPLVSAPRTLELFDDVLDLINSHPLNLPLPNAFHATSVDEGNPYIWYTWVTEIPERLTYGEAAEILRNLRILIPSTGMIPGFNGDIYGPGSPPQSMQLVGWYALLL